jgi:hypothetical protein
VGREASESASVGKKQRFTPEEEEMREVIIF